MEFKFKDIVKAQAILESGHFNSDVFRQNNNVFGIRLPKKRETTAIGSKMGYAVYDDICLSIEDRLLYEKRYLSKFTKEQYYNYLNRVYAKNKVYSKKLKDIQKRFASVK
jgi:flagellum-specific peptidoglycan hydrolase FlgJ